MNLESTSLRSTDDERRRKSEKRSSHEMDIDDGNNH